MKTLLLLLFPLFCLAQSNAKNLLAVINDQDGFTFVREKADKNSKIVDTIYKNEVFLCEENLENGWYKVVRDEIGGRYMHKSRIKAVFLMSLSEQKALIEYGFTKQYDNLKAYQNELDLFEKDKSTAVKIEEKRKIRQDFMQNNYSYYQSIFKDYYCKTADEETLLLCFKTIIADKGNHEQSYADIFLSFVCRNVEMITVLNTYSGENREYLLRFIECGYYYLNHDEKVDKSKVEIASIDKPYLPYLKQLKTAFERVKIKGRYCDIPE